MKGLQRLMIAVLALLLAIPPLSARAEGGSGGASEAAEYVRIKNTWQGYYLYEASDGKVKYGFTQVNDPASQWKIEDKDGYKRLRNRATGHYLHSQSVTEPNITNALESSDIPAGWTSDTWEIAAAPDNPGGYNIVSSRNSAWIVNFQIQDGFVQANNWAQKSWGSAVWSFEPAEATAPVRIANPWDGSYLYEQDGEVKYGRPSLNDTTSHWFLEDKDGYKRLRNRATGHYLHSQDVTAETITHPIGISDIGSGWTSDLWTLEDAGNGSVNIVSSRDAGWIVNIQGTGGGPDGIVRVNNWAQKSWGSAVWKLEAASDSAPKRLRSQWTGAYLYEDNGQVKYGEPNYDDASSQWIVEDGVDGKRLRNVGSGGYATTIDHAGATPLAVNAGAGPDSVWLMEQARNDGGGEVDGFVTLRSLANAGSFINVQNQDGYAQGNNWAQATWGSAQWKLEDPAPPTGPVNPYIRIKNNWLQLYLYEDNGTVKYGNADAADQRAHWQIEEAGGVQRIKNRATGHYVSLEGVSGARDALKAVEPAPGSTAGDWTIETYQGYKLISRAGEASGSYVNVENKLKHAQYGVVPKDWGSPKWEFHPVTETASEYVRLKNSYRGTYLYEDSDGKVAYGQPDASDASSHWSFQQGSEGVRIVNRATGRFISNERIARSVPEWHLTPLESLELDPTWGSVQWAVYEVGDPGSSVKTFSNQWSGTAVIHVEDGTGYAQASDIPQDWGSAQWIVEPAPAAPVELPDGYIRIKNRASGQYLFENGNRAVLYGTPAENNAASHWKLIEADGAVRIENRATGNAISIAGGRSYLETESVPPGGKARWAIERGPESGVYLLRSEASGYEDGYMHTEDAQGYAQFELRSVESRGVQWLFEEAPAEAINVPWDNGPANGVTPELAETNEVRIVDAVSGKVLVARGGAVALETPSETNEAASRWLPYDYNGHKRLVNPASGRMLAIGGDGKAAAVFDGAGLASQWKIDDYAGYRVLRNAAAASGEYLVRSPVGEAVSQAANPSAVEAHWRLELVAGDARYEAEQAFMTGGVVSGGSYATGFGSENAALLFSVYAGEAGDYETVVRYRNSSGSGKTLGLSVNGLEQNGGLALPALGGSWSETVVTLSLRAGMNTVTLQSDEAAPASSGVDIDAIAVRGTSKPDYRGATLPFTTYEAEHGRTNGALLEPDRTYKTFALEASGRQAVRLDAEGQYVEFTAVKDANSLVVRYIIPDAQEGGGIEETLTLYVNGVKRGKLALSSEHSWVYGAYPWTNDPADGDAHRFYDESRMLTDPIPEGATVRLQKDADDQAEYVIVDLVELEQAPEAYAKPDGYLSVMDFGAVADDAGDDWNAFRDAIAAAKAQDKGLWIPAGTFQLRQGPLYVDNVTIRGAGMWHTTLQGAGFMAEGSNIRVYDLLLDVDVTSRRDEEREAGFDGTFGAGSVIQNVWIEHAKAGIWSMRSDEGVATDGLYIGGVRIRNTYADGINLTSGTRSTMIEQTHIRNSGDDSIALWSQRPDDAPPEAPDDDYRTSNNTIRFNTIQLPWLADNVAIFGGRDNKVQDNVISDTVGFGAGIAISTRFNPVAFDGTTIVERNTLIRTGGREPNWGQDFGAIWIFTGDKPIDADILIRDNVAADSTYQGLYINGPHPIADSPRRVRIQNYVIDGAGTWGIHVNSSVTGSVELDNVLIRNPKLGSVFNAMGAEFELRTLTKQPGGNGSGGSGGSGSASGAGGTADQTAANQDAPLKQAVAEGRQEIVIDLAGESGGEAEFTSEALRAAAASLPNAVIVLKFGDLSYSLPTDILDVLGAAGYPLAKEADAKLKIKLSYTSDQEEADLKIKAETSGFRIAGMLVIFDMTLEAGGQSIPIHRFGQRFLTRTFTVEGASDIDHYSVVVFDPVNGVFRTVPAMFSAADGRTLATVKSATNSIYAVAITDETFEDIARHWARTDIERMANKRLVNGTAANKFAPNRNVSRAEMATLIVRALGLQPDSGAGNRFADVAPSAWYASYVNAAASYGIVNGHTNGSFAPDKEVTRAEMAVMLAQAMRLAKTAAPGVSSSDSGSVKSFDGDREPIPNWARSAADELVREGIMQGRSSNTFAPGDSATRAEAIVALRRLLQAVDFMN